MSWTQRGTTLTAGGAESKVALNSNGTVMVLGEWTVNTNTGRVRVFKFVNGSWVQEGNDINGPETNSQFGFSVDINSDGTVIAVGAPQWSNFTGRAYVYALQSGNWAQRGNTFEGPQSNGRLGYAVRLNSNGNTLIISRPFNNQGFTRVYNWNGSSWSEKGSEIVGEQNGGLSGLSVDISSDGDVISIGEQWYSSGRGAVRIFDFINNEWAQRGIRIPGLNPTDFSGFASALNSDGTVIIIGARQNDGPTGVPDDDNRGHARVFVWNGTTWIQRGTDLYGENPTDWAGYSVSINSDGTIIALSAPLNDINTGNPNDDRGQVRIYGWNGTSWIPRGDYIYGFTSGEYIGESISLSSNGNIVAFASWTNTVYVYEFSGGFDSGIDGITEPIAPNTSYSDFLTTNIANVTDREAFKQFMRDSKSNFAGDIEGVALLTPIAGVNTSGLYSVKSVNLDLTKNINIVTFEDGDTLTLDTTLVNNLNNGDGIHFLADAGDTITLNINSINYELQFTTSGIIYDSVEYFIDQSLTFGSLTLFLRALGSGTLQGQGNGGGGSEPVCFLEDTIIKTTKGYKKIQDLRSTDYVINYYGEGIPIKYLAKGEIKHLRPRTKVYPYLIPKHTFGDNIPSQNTYVSPSHIIYIDEIPYTTKELKVIMDDDTIEQQFKLDKPLIYYNIVIDTKVNYDEDSLYYTMYANNMLVETCNPNNEKLKSYSKIY